MKIQHSLSHWQWLGILALWLAATPSLVAAQAVPPEEDQQDAVAELYALPGRPVVGEPIDDVRLLRYLDIEGRRLSAAGLTLTNWAGQLGDRAVTLKLPKPSRRSRKPEEIARQMESSVGVIGTFYLCAKCSKLHLSMASGFFISETGAFATCRHVLGGFEKNGGGIVILTRDGQMHPVRSILACDRANDLLVVQAEGKGFSALPLAAEAPMAGTPVYVVSHPEQHFYMFTTGVIGRQSVRRNRYGTASFLTITADFAKGSSGAPVCNESGAVVGIVNNTESIYYSVEKDQQKNLQMVLKNCSPSPILAGMMSGKAVTRRQPKGKEGESLTDLAEQLTRQIAAREWDKAEASLAHLEKLAPLKENAGLDLLRFHIAVGKGDLEAAAPFAAKVSEAHPDNAELQNQLAWELVKGGKIKGAALATALHVARQGNEAAHGEDGAILDTLARALFLDGQKDKAIEVQEEAVGKATEETLKESLQKTLESYRKGELPPAD